MSSTPTKGRDNFKVDHGERTLTPSVFTKIIDTFIFKSINDEKGIFAQGLGLKLPINTVNDVVYKRYLRGWPHSNRYDDCLRAIPCSAIFVLLYMYGSIAATCCVYLRGDIRNVRSYRKCSVYDFFTINIKKCYR